MARNTHSVNSREGFCLVTLKIAVDVDVTDIWIVHVPGQDYTSFSLAWRQPTSGVQLDNSFSYKAAMCSVVTR